jgi:hypothetical protein
MVSIYVNITVYLPVQLLYANKTIVKKLILKRASSFVTTEMKGRQEQYRLGRDATSGIPESDRGLSRSKNYGCFQLISKQQHITCLPHLKSIQNSFRICAVLQNGKLYRFPLWKYLNKSIANTLSFHEFLSTNS